MIKTYSQGREGSNKFKMCSHEKLIKRDERKKKRLVPGSPSFLALEKIVKSQYLLGDLKHLTNFNHTVTLEVYHSVYNKYCLNQLHFSFPVMIARAELAVLDFNAGIGLPYAKTKKVEFRFKQQFLRIIQSCFVKKVTDKKERIYMEDLMEQAIAIKTSNMAYPLPCLKNVPKI